MTSLRIGLTGGIGCGKSTVASHFAALGIPTIDADEVARSLMEPGQTGFEQVVAAFGTGIVRDGQIDRRALRQQIFSNAADRHRVENILHPLVYRELERWALRHDTPYCMLSIPLLLETAPPNLVDRVLVVDCSLEHQIDRVTMRDGLGREDVLRIITAQMSRTDRLRAADDVISNAGSPLELRARVDMLHRRYLDLAQVSQGTPHERWRIKPTLD